MMISKINSEESRFCACGLKARYMVSFILNDEIKHDFFCERHFLKKSPLIESMETISLSPWTKALKTF